MSRTAGLEYQIGPHREGEYSLTAIEILHAEEWKVRERWFTGSVRLRIGDAYVERKDIALLDFALALRFSVNLLAADGIAVMHPSSGSPLRFTEKKGVVEARSDELDVVGVSEFIDLARVSSVFTRDLLGELVEIRPEFLLNEAIERTYRESAVRESSRKRFLIHTQMMRMRSAMIRDDNS